MDSETGLEQQSIEAMESESSPELTDVNNQLKGQLTDWYANWAEELATHPSTGYVRWTTHRLFETIATAKKDVRDSEHRFTTAALGTLTASSFAFDKSRIPMAVIPALAVEEFKNSGSIWRTALVASGAFFIWNTGNGAVLTEGIEEYPQTLEKAKDNFPEVVDFFTDSLPGIKSKAEIQEAQKVYEKKLDPRYRQAGRWSLLQLRRAMVGLGLGSTAFVATASTQEYSRTELHKLNLKVSTDTAVAIFGIAAGLAKVLTEVAESNPQLGQDILEVVEDTRFWYGIALGEMAVEWAISHSKKNPKTEKGILTKVIEKVDFRYPDRAAYHFDPSPPSPDE